MPVYYTDKIASRGGFGSFFRLLVRWRGSVYKMVWQDMLVYIVMYYILSIIYRFALNLQQRTTFEMVVMHCARFRNLIPISFVLGFFVSLVVNRWWETYKTIPWPDTTAILLTTLIPGQDEESKYIRSTILRYINLTIAMTFSTISPAVERKLKSFNALMNEGYLTEDEVKILNTLENHNGVSKHWVPIMWACKLVDKARNEDLISCNSHQRTIIMEILNVRGKCGGLLGINSNNIPLVYVQVVTIAVYSFFVFSIIGEQFLDPEMKYNDHIIDLYFPWFSLLQIFFYIGWIKVAEALLNPFGEDDHDFEFLPLLERHKTMSAMLSEPGPLDLPSAILTTGEKTSMNFQNGKPDSKGSILTPSSINSPVETVVTTDSGATYFTCNIST